LANLISDLTLSPGVVNTILDTDVGESWIPAISEFELRLEGLKVRGRVRAARDLSEVAEALRIVVCFFVWRSQLLTRTRRDGLAGGYKNTLIFPRSPATHPFEYDHEHACSANDRVSQVPSTIHIFDASCFKRGHGVAEGLCCDRTYVL
jgi:hypothetical protein